MARELTKEQAADIIQILLWTRSDFIDTEKEALEIAIEELSGEHKDE